MVFDICQQSERRNFKPIFNKKLYPLKHVSILHRCFDKMIASANNNVRTSIKNLQTLPIPRTDGNNPWFKKAATILALNTKINIQKSFWRMKFNTSSKEGLPFNTVMIVKLKKMYNNIRKYYDLNMYRSFLMIQKYAASNGGQHEEQVVVRSVAVVRPPSEPEYERNDARLDSVVLAGRKISLSMMDRIFKKNMNRQIKTWVHNAFPERKLDYVNTQIIAKDKEDYEFVAKIGSLESLSKLNKQIAYRAKAKAFRNLVQNFYDQKEGEGEVQNVDKVLELLNRQNQLMEEIRTSKEDNEYLSNEIESKDKNLRDANETVTILSLRINYMITQKFINMIEKVFESVEYRHLNDSFDALIDQANENFEQEEGEIFDE